MYVSGHARLRGIILFISYRRITGHQHHDVNSDSVNCKILQEMIMIRQFYVAR